MEKAALLGDRDAGLSHWRSGSRRRRGAPVEGRDMDFRQRTAASIGAGSCWLSWVRLVLPFTIGYRGRVALRRRKAAPAVAISSTGIAGSRRQRCAAGTRFVFLSPSAFLRARRRWRL
nr:hypothetical protein Itr_chr08CG10370 [Ipomoea trifida]